MKNFRSLILLLSMFVGAVPAQAQSDSTSKPATQGTPVKIGIGVTFGAAAQSFLIQGSYTFYSPSGSNYYYSFYRYAPVFSVLVPIQIGNTLRIEPEIGFASNTTENKYSAGTSGFPPYPYPPQSSKQTDTDFRIGLGGFYVFGQGQSLRPYLGGRVSLVSFNSFVESTIFSTTYSPTGQPIYSTSIQTVRFNAIGWSVAAAVGGDYFFAENFSLGGEIQFGYAALGNPKVEFTPASSVPTTTEYTQSQWQTRGFVAVRFYF
ncbi:MAG: outer membrane beta-barrel protein [Rhizobacter sp.]|nr:outer membrane beta-barrel protein [Chlorobiales bacterium]